MKSAVCLIVRNEVRDVAEWLAFHSLVGFDTLIVIDNGSHDGTDAVVRRAAALHDIRYHDWPYSHARSQEEAYDVACRTYGPEFDWIAFIDSDEFLIPTADEPINRFFARFDGWSGIALHWAVYGSSGHDDFPPGLVLESFTKRAGTDFFPARHVKSVVRPGFVERCLNAHSFELRENRLGGYCDASGRPVQWWPAPERGGVLAGLSTQLPDYSLCRVNHYFTRSRAHWQAKLRRGYPSDVAVRTEADFVEHDRNEVDDPIAQRYLPALRLAVSRIEQ